MLRRYNRLLVACGFELAAVAGEKVIHCPLPEVGWFPDEGLPGPEPGDPGDEAPVVGSDTPIDERLRVITAVLEAVDRALEAQLCRGVQARGAHPRALEQPAAFRPGRLDHSLGVALCRGDGIRRVAFSREYPVDRPCNGCIG